MAGKFIFYGRVPSRVTEGNLHIPEAVRSFYECDKDYVLEKENSSGFNYLIVHPIEEVLKNPQENLELPEGSSVPLEKLIINGMTRGLKLPERFRGHLGIGKDAQVLLIGYGKRFGIWRSEDFKIFGDSMGVEQMMEKLAGLNIR
ncbi:hypothetical protein HYX08_05425 [Candidatus Woesearchaeota archaeon]|nr:hypothetical protein [Candidatus Woesearchaeota archaeon]